MKFDLSLVPFSRYGSYLSFSHLKQTPFGAGVFLRSVRGDVPVREILRVELTDHGKVVPYEIEARPECLSLKSRCGRLEICFEAPQVVRLCGTGGVRLTLCAIGTFGNAFPAQAGAWQINAWESRLQLMLTSLRGEMKVDAPMDVARCKRVVVELCPGPGGEPVECALDEFLTSWEPRRYAASFERCVAAAGREFRQWLKAAPPTAPALAAARELAAYVNWSSVVAPSGHFKRPAMLMSKNWMVNLWSWDHCFNALALTGAGLRDRAYTWTSSVFLLLGHDTARPA